MRRKATGMDEASERDRENPEFRSALHRIINIERCVCTLVCTVQPPIPIQWQHFIVRVLCLSLKELERIIEASEQMNANRLSCNKK